MIRESDRRLVEIVPTERQLRHDGLRRNFAVWFDGACEEGPDGKRQVYDWKRYYEVVRRLQPEACLQMPEGVTACDIMPEWETAVKIRRVVLKENLRCSQRIESFEIQAWSKEAFHTVYRGTTVGYKHIAAVEELDTTRLRVRIPDARVSPVIAFLGVY